MRALIALALAAALTACGVQPEAAKQEAPPAAESGDIFSQAARIAASAVDTRTMCTVAGQSEAFCGCLQTRLGEHLPDGAVETLSTLLRHAAAGEDLPTIARSAETIDPPTRDAILSCANNPSAATPAPAETPAP